VVASDAAKDGTPQNIQSRIKETLTTMQMFDDWYTDVARLPRKVQMAALHMGARIARFLPKSRDTDS